MRDKFEVRRATLSDLEVVFEIARELGASFTLSRPDFERIFREVIVMDEGVVLVLEKDGEVLGYCLAFDHPAFYANGRVSWVAEIAVRADKRGNGLGRRLMEAVEEWARSRKSKLIGLATRRAPGFYKALDYEESAAYFRKILRG